jgi:glycosyltransferase involved in cell wall biosynthesis
VVAGAAAWRKKKLTASTAVRLKRRLVSGNQTMTRPPRILFVAMQNSSHTMRWTRSVTPLGFDLHLFGINHHPVLPGVRGVTVHIPVYRLRPRATIRALMTRPTGWLERLRIAEQTVQPSHLPHRPIYNIALPYHAEIAADRYRTPLGAAGANAPILYGPRTLARLIDRLRPDLIHSMEFQHCAYNVLQARKYCRRGFPAWLATNWGSDIYFYRQFDDHLRQIKEILSLANFYSCECARDVRIAAELGFRGTVLPVAPNAGGFDVPEARRWRTMTPPSRRKLVMIKGYQHFAGRALTALEAVERCADQLRDYEIVIFSAMAEAAERAHELMAYTPLKNIIILPRVPHDQMLRLFARARVYLGVSVSDGISTSALEALAMGAFPIQTNTSCCDEWFEDGKGGFLVPPDNVEMIADRLRHALTDDVLVDEAAEHNWPTVVERLDADGMTEQVARFYRVILDQLAL